MHKRSNYTYFFSKKARDDACLSERSAKIAHSKPFTDHIPVFLPTFRPDKKNEAVPPQHYLSPNQIKPNYL